MQLMNIPFCSSALHYVLLAWRLIEHGGSFAFGFMGISHRATNRREGILLSPALQGIWVSTGMNINPSRTKHGLFYINTQCVPRSEHSVPWL